MASREEYYGSNDIESLSFLEFGSIDIINKKRTTWAYWQDQDAYDLYMFARYARDLFSFRNFIENGVYTLEELSKCIKKSAHDKLLDYVFKYVGLAMFFEGGEQTQRVCESGSSLYGFIEESIALDAVLAKGKNISSIKSLKYLCSDISTFMNNGAVSFHADIDITKSIQPTIADLFSKDVEQVSLFYGLGVSLRYALRGAEDIVLAAEKSELIVFNRISLTRNNDTEKLIYGTGKCEYIVSLPMLSQLLENKGFYCRYCSENMQYNKDGDSSVRVSMIISKDKEMINRYEKLFDECLNKCKAFVDNSKVTWRDIRDLL